MKSEMSQRNTLQAYRRISTLEQYATYKVRPLFVHIGGCIYHMIVALPFLIVLIAINIGAHSNIEPVLLLAAVVLSFAFLSAAAMVLGGLFRNPNISSPIISMLYMIIVMLTPFYAELDKLSQSTKLIYCFNPFAHITSLFGGGFGQPVLCQPIISVAVLFALTIILGIMSFKRWYSTYGAEKLGVF